MAALISLIGDKTYKLLRDLVSPEKPQDKTFTVLTEILKKKLSPQRIIVAERFHFHRCVQAEGQSINNFVAKLREKASTCNFGQFLKEALRDQFIAGIRSRSILTKLLSEDRGMDAAVAIALAAESARNEAHKIGPESTLPTTQSDTEQVFQLQDGRYKSNADKTLPNIRCYRCGRGHDQATCPFKFSTCHGCQKQGHIRPMCKNIRRQGGIQKDRPVHLVRRDSENEGDRNVSDVYSLYNMCPTQQSVQQLSVQERNQ